MKPVKKEIDLAALEEKMGEVAQVECQVKHTFSPGLYVRELFIPKGTLVLGKRHRHETCNVLASGKLRLYMGEGVPDAIIEGPMVFTSAPGVKKLAYALEDTVFLNIHPTNETDLEKIEAEFIIPENEYLETKETPWLG